MERCDEYKISQKKLGNMFIGIGINSYYCPIYLKNLSIIGVYGDVDKYSYFHLYLRPCRNKTDGNICESPEKINGYLTNTFIDFKTISYNVDSLSKNPYKEILYSERFAISNSVFKRVWIYIKTVYYTTDIGYVFEDKETQSFFQIYQLVPEIDLRDTEKSTVPGSFLTMTFLNHKEITTYNRVYQKFQDFLANVGGIIKGIMMIASIINIFVSQNLYYQYLINNISEIKYDIYRSFKNENKNFQAKDFNKNKDNENNINKNETPSQRSNLELNIDKSNINNFADIDTTLRVNAQEKNEKVTMKIDSNKFCYSEMVKENFQFSIKFTQIFLPSFLLNICNKKKSFNELAYLKSIKRIDSQLNIENILNKFFELDNLNKASLSKDQLTAFNYFNQIPITDEEKINKEIFENAIEGIKNKSIYEKRDYYLLMKAGKI